MINHHPKTQLLNAFASGELPASLSAALSIHLEFCPKCKQRFEAITEDHATQFELSSNDIEITHTNEAQSNQLCISDLDEMINEITCDTRLADIYEAQHKAIELGGKQYKLPRALSNMAFGNWTGLGKLTRSRIDLNEGDVRTSLLEIKPGGKIPEHTHTGFELTLLLEGSFKDEMGEYHAGDFIWLDGEHTHNPMTENGCLCFTVVSDKLQFTQGFNKLLNPIGGLIY